VSRRVGEHAGVAALAAMVALGPLAGCGGHDDPEAAPALRVVDAYLAPSDGEVAAAYVVVADDGGGDLLVGAKADVADEVTLHATEERGGLAVMTDADELEVPAGGELRLEPNGSHLMLGGLAGALEPGATVHLELSFRTSAPLEVDARVLSYDQIDARLGGAT
jgi:copper(I)-binding protein